MALTHVLEAATWAGVHKIHPKVAGFLDAAASMAVNVHENSIETLAGIGEVQRQVIPVMTDYKGEGHYEVAEVVMTEEDRDNELSQHQAKIVRLDAVRAKLAPALKAG